MNSFRLNIDNETYKIIEKYCGIEYKEKLFTSIEKIKDFGKIKVANTGLVSSGKSSLFNALVDKYDQERFPTGAARTTLNEDEEVLVDNIYLIDTPGIDVRSNDDKVAFKSILNSDIIMIIHNIKMGEPTKNEIEWIKKISNEMYSDEEKRDRLIFVCSWIDERDKSETYDVTINKTKQMVFDAVGSNIDFIEVSTKRYISGKNKDKENMIEKSGIPKLRQLCIAKANAYNLKYSNSRDKKYISNLCNDTIFRLKEKSDEKCETVKQIENRVNKSYSFKQSSWENILKQFENKKEKIRNLERELSRI